MDTFGSKLKKLRTDKGKQQKEVAIDLDISSTGYSSYENDLRMPGIKMLIKIADYYNVSTDYLLGRVNKVNLDKNKLLNELDYLSTYINSMQNYIKNTK